MKIAVLGLGSIGRRHLKNLRALLPQGHILACRLHHGQAPEPQVAAWADQTLYGLPALLEARPQAVILAGPASTHLETGLALVRAGAHLLIEKPLAQQSAGLEQLLAESARRGQTLLVGYNLRFHPGVRALKTALEQGLIGRLMTLRAEVGQYLPSWRPGTDWRVGVSARPELGGGALLELSHELDLCLWLAGAARKVFCRLGNLSDLELAVEDSAELSLELESGALASLHLDMAARPTRRSCTLLGTTGTLEWEAMAGVLRLWRAGENAWRTLWQDPDYDRNRMYVDELAHFLACVQGQEQPLVSGQAGLAALALVEAAHASAASGREVLL